MFDKTIVFKAILALLFRLRNFISPIEYIRLATNGISIPNEWSYGDKPVRKSLK